MTLIERIEAATGPDRELFWEAFNAAFPEPAPGCEPVWRPENPKQPIYHAWKTRQVAFQRFIDAEAWEQAALMLLPIDGSMTLIDLAISWQQEDSKVWPAATIRWYPPHKSGPEWHAQIGSACTIGLTIAAIALRAREASREA